jgi:hypothetical protein
VTPFPTIDALREGLGGKAASAAPAIDPAYAAKMLHPLPANATVVNRRAFILERAAGKVVLDVGATGPMHALLVQKAAKVYGWDREDGPGVTGVNLDAVGLQLPVYPDVELIVLGEVLEHLSNPGHFLNALRAAYACPTIVTVPNAYCMLGRGHLARGYDCVNGDHVAWHSPKTLAVLLERAGYEIREFFYYNGRPNEPIYQAEGLIAVTG